MARSSRQRQDDVVSRRLDIAAAPAGKPPIVDAGLTGRTHALLAGASLGLDGQQDGRRAVARRMMLAGHGCTGARCRHPAHEPDRAAMGELLSALGLDGQQ